MAVTIRLARYGSKKKPFYRVVATDSRSPRDGRFLALLGTYDPRNKDAGLDLKLNDIQDWISRGAQVSDTVRKLMKQSVRAEPSPDQ
jgi:small subunit ribosomal protein S16